MVGDGRYLIHGSMEGIPFSHCSDSGTNGNIELADSCTTACLGGQLLRFPSDARKEVGGKSHDILFDHLIILGVLTVISIHSLCI